MDVFVYSVLVLDIFFILRGIEACVVCVRVSNTCESSIAMSDVAFDKNNTLSSSNVH
jgi:hypothetical protein